MDEVVKNDMSHFRYDSAVVIDDHPIARMAMINILQAEGVTKIYEAEDGAAGLEIVKKIQPNLVILDVDIPVINGIDVINRLRSMKYFGIIIVVSAKNEKFYSKRSAEFGANAFVSKKDGMSTIISAIHATHEGYSYYPFSLDLFSGIYSTEMDLMDSLSLQEMNVMHYIAKGFSNTLIAEKMSISCKTVSTYKRRIMDKLRCHSLTELLSFLQRNSID